MSENLFDNFIKDKLHDHESHVPQGLWDKVLVDIDKKKKPLPFWKNGYFQSAIIGIVAVGLFSAGYITSKHNNTVTGNIKEYVTSPTLTKSLVNTVNTAKHNEINDSRTNTLPSKTTLTTRAEKQLSKNSDKAIVKVDKVNKTTESVTNTSVESKKVKAVRVIVDKATKLITETDNNSKINKENIISNKKSVASISDKVTSTPEIAETTTTAPVVAEATNEDVLNNGIANYFVKGDLVSTELNVSSLGIIKRTLSANTNTITNIHLPNTNKKGWTVELYASPDYDVKKVSTTNNDAYYLHVMDSSNKTSIGFTAGFRIGKSIGHNFSLKSGLQFKETTERFRYLKQTDIKDFAVLTTRSYTDNTGSTIYVTDTSVLQQKGYVIRTVYNTYKSIEIPVIVSWEKSMNKFHVAVSGGAIFNLSTFYEGQTFDNTYNVVPLSAKQSNGIFKSKANVSIYGSLNFLYSLRKDMDAFAEPYYKVALGNNSTTANGISQGFNTAGINFGIRYNIPSLKSIK